jgi:CubicO group peptidase (beta-lactamase class C family)
MVLQPAAETAGATLMDMKLLWCAALAARALCGQSFSGAPAVDQVIEEAIRQDRLPGAVLLVGHDGQVIYRKAYGQRAVYPKAEPMTVDTIFDCASLTKVLATTPSLMKLFEEGKFRLNDKVTDRFPEFQGGKSDITLRNLFTHFSGLRPDLTLMRPASTWP